MDAPSQLTNMLDICKKFSSAADVMALAAKYSSPSAGISKMQKEKMSQEAVQALARFLPKEKAVDWAIQSARKAGEKVGLLPAESKALEAAQAWAASPVEVNRVAAATAAATLPANSPTAWAAHAAALSAGVESPAGGVSPAISDDLTAHCAAGAVLLAAAKLSPDGVPEVPQVSAPTDNTLQMLPNPDGLLRQSAAQVSVPSQPQPMTRRQLREAAKRLAPFIELGMTLAKTVPGWHKA
jgi:hypothetical protein